MTHKDFMLLMYTNKWFYVRKNIVTYFMKQVVSEPTTMSEGQVVLTSTGHVLFDGKQQITLDTQTEGPFISFYEPVTLSKGDLPNLDRDITTTMGTLLVNILCIIYPFGNRIPFMEGQINAKRIEAIVAPLLVDTPIDGDDPVKEITVAMFQKYVVATRLLMNISGGIIASATRKNVVPPPGVEEFKRQLDKELDITDPVQQAEYMKRLVAFDAEHLKGDPSFGILMSGKMTNRARIKLYGSFGTEASFQQGVNTKFITNSLNHGLPTDSKTVSELNSSMRAASYGRGKLTVIGGVLAKLMTRIVSDTTIVAEDCGTTRYLRKRIHQGSDELTGMYIIIDGSPVMVTSSILKQYHGQVVSFRSPGYCITPGTNFCRYCCGEKMFSYKTGVKLASMAASGQITQMFLSSIHGVDNNISKIEWDFIIDED